MYILENTHLIRLLFYYAINIYIHSFSVHSYSVILFKIIVLVICMIEKSMVIYCCQLCHIIMCLYLIHYFHSHNPVKMFVKCLYTCTVRYYIEFYGTPSFVFLSPGLFYR